MAEAFDVINIIGSGPRRLRHRDPRSAARLQGCDCREAISWRHLPELGLHSELQGAAALWLTLYHLMQHAKDYWPVGEVKISYDPKAVVARSRGVAKRLSDGVAFLMKKNKVSVIWGEATIDAPGKVMVKAGKVEAIKGALGPDTYTAKHIIVATGARPRALPGLEGDGKLVWTYFEAMNPDKMPKSLLVVGSGAIGIEFASFYRTLGVDVTVVEVLPQILPVEDAEIQTFARKAFEKQGMKIMTGAKVTKLEKKADSVICHIDDGKGGTQKIEVDRVISAVGVVGNVEGLGLEKLGVKNGSWHHRHRRHARPTCRASMPSAMSPARRCWRTRPNTKASSALRRSRASSRMRWTSA